MKKIILMPLYGIGDTLMSTPAIRNLKERTGAHITFMHMFRTTYDVATGNPNVDANIHFPFLNSSRLDSFKMLLSHRGTYDISINLYPSNRREYTLAAFVVGCRQRIGHRYLIRDLLELNFLKNRTVMEDESLHNVEENLRLLKFLGIEEPTPYAMEIYLSDAERTAARAWIERAGLVGRMVVGLHPGTSAFKDQYKRRWPAERFALFIKEVAASYPDSSFVLFGGPEENDLKSEIVRMSGLGGRVLIADMRSIRESIALIGECNYFVANDSGLMHAAATMQVPTVAIFGPTNPVYVRPWMCRHRVVRLKDSCGPCFKYSPLPLRCDKQGEFPCISGIEVRDVLDAFTDLMEETSSPRK